MELLEMIETIKVEEASISRLFNTRADGTGVRGVARQRGQDPTYVEMFAEAAEFLGQVLDGRRPVYHLQEAMGTSDFPLLFGDILDRVLLAGYRETPSTFRNYAKVRSVRDFRQVKAFTVDGAEGRLSKVPPQTEYPERALTEGQFVWAVEKYGARMDFSWETMINDDLDALKDTPTRFGRAARRTEEFTATDLFAGTTGPDGTFFAAGNANIVTANPALSIAALQTAMTVLAAQRDTDGEPIVITAVELVVPPALEITAMNILNALQLEIVEAGGTANQKLITTNWMKGRVRLNVNPYLPIISTTNGNTSWYLFANPNDGRPAMEVGFLRGHEEPEVFMKSPNAVRVGGGGLTDPMNGDFDVDAVAYKIRHVLGGSLIDPKMAVASNGTGS